MRPRTGWCSSGSPANDPTSASNSPVSKPSKNGTLTSSRLHFSCTCCSTGTENSSGTHGIRQSVPHPRVHVRPSRSEGTWSEGLPLWRAIGMPDLDDLRDQRQLSVPR
jgi:hypothetical protein